MIPTTERRVIFDFVYPDGRLGAKPPKDHNRYEATCEGVAFKNVNDAQPYTAVGHAIKADLPH